MRVQVGVSVDFEWSSACERVVRPDRVEQLAVALRLDAELVAVVDVDAVEPLVLQGVEAALADAVLAGAVHPRADVDQFRPAGDELRELVRLEAGAVVADEADRADLAGVRVG